MSSDPKIRKTEDKDESCRLRHGLNVHCLAHIFQYLDSADLYTLGGMNEFYNQIINDLVIPKHEVNFNNLYKRNIRIPQVFERYGKKIRKINFKKDFNVSHTIDQLVQSITQYCEPDQLKSVEINCETLNNVPLPNVHLPNQFRSVERFEFYGIYRGRLSVQLSGTLRYLSLSDIELDPNFNWKILRNLTEIYLDDVEGINVQNFIEFLHLEPKLRVFHHDRYTFEHSTQDICEAMAKYCGNEIQDYSGKMVRKQDGGTRAPANLYDFISHLKNVKKVCLESQQICGGDLIDSLKRLAENNTIESLDMTFLEDHAVNCNFQERPNLEGLDMRPFSHLKTIAISGFWDNPFDSFQNGNVCEPFKLLSIYGPQIFVNVENLTIEDAIHDWDILKFAPKLRHLEFYHVGLTTPNQPTEILSSLERILRQRNNGQIQSDFIEIKFSDQCVYDIFTGISGRSDSIKLSMR